MLPCKKTGFIIKNNVFPNLYMSQFLVPVNMIS